MSAGRDFCYAGPTGRRCQTCGLPIPEDVVLPVDLSGAVVTMCRECQIDALPEEDA